MNGRLSTGRQAHDEAQGVPARITFTNTFSYKHEKTNSKLNSKPKMEAERRSTMSSLKGQLSNVEGSVKSMKVAVVVGSVLTVACLAAVFGVTVLANEVSKEVKVSNGVLATKAGNAVMTTSAYATTDMSVSGNDLSVFLKQGDLDINAKIQSSISKSSEYVYVLDGAVLTVNKASGEQSLSLAQGSLLQKVLDSEAVEARNLNIIWKVFLAQAAWAAARFVGGLIVGAIIKGVYKAVKNDPQN